MATPQSANRMFNGLDEDVYNDAKYAHEINDRMRVPKRIKATGEYSDDDVLLSNQNGIINSWNYHDKVDMNVPDRIVVLGHNQHLETRSAPREILLENSILAKDSTEVVRVRTPPRTITLSDHHFPSASEENSPRHNGYDSASLNADYEEDFGHELLAKTGSSTNKKSVDAYGCQHSSGAASLDLDSDSQVCIYIYIFFLYILNIYVALLTVLVASALCLS